MKKITLLFLLFLTITTWSYSQCTTTTGAQWPTATITVLNNGTAETISANNWPNAEYSLLQGLVVGNTYTVAGTNASTVFITVAETTAMFDFGGTIIGQGLTSVSFTATTPEILVYWHLDALCGVQTNVDTATTIQCTSASCTCTATAAPGAATAPTPADAAIDVPLVGTGVDFSWVGDTTGDIAESFTISIGLTPTGDDIGSLANTNGGVINFGAANNTTYYWKIDAINCAGTTSSAVWSFTTTACTALAGPDVATMPMPADAGIDIPIDITDPMNLLITPFSWVDATTGDAADSYDLTLGVTPTGDDIGTLTGATSGNGVNYPWAYSTTYYWKVDGINCFGTTPGTVWSFTTEADPGLSVEEFDTKSFSVFPNPAEDVITVDANVNINTIEIYNQLGQRVIQLNEAQITNNTVNVSELNKGIYFIKVASEDRKQTIKFIKK